MPRCKMCGGDMIVTLDNICLICNPPTEKQIETIATIMVLVKKHIKEIRNSS
jgi:hypothetical protein